MHPAQIKAALTIAGYRQTDAAVACEVAPTTIGAVINGRSRSKQVEEWIAEATGRTLLELWPQWYGQGGEITLTDDERQLVLAYRDLSVADRQRALAQLQHGLPRETPATARGAVVAVGGSIATGGNVTIGGRRKR